jgi:hypothetical protein
VGPDRVQGYRLTSCIGEADEERRKMLIDLFSGQSSRRSWIAVGSIGGKALDASFDFAVGECVYLLSGQHRESSRESTSQSPVYGWGKPIPGAGIAFGMAADSGIQRNDLTTGRHGNGCAKLLDDYYR